MPECQWDIWLFSKSLNSDGEITEVRKLELCGSAPTVFNIKPLRGCSKQFQEQFQRAVIAHGFNRGNPMQQQYLKINPFLAIPRCIMEHNKLIILLRENIIFIKSTLCQPLCHSSEYATMQGQYRVPICPTE